MYTLKVLFVLEFLFVSVALGDVSPKIDKSIKNCPKDEMTLAKEYMLLESMGRRAFNKAKDSCYKNAKTKYVYKLKSEASMTNDVVFVKSVNVTKVNYNKKYDQHDAFIEAVLEDGSKVKDQFRFMRLGQPGGKRPTSGCALFSISPSKAYVLESCKR